MSVAIGSIDALRRPLVRLRRIGTDDDYLALLDTGFNGDLYMDEGTAVRLGFDLRAEKDLVTFADGREESVRLGRGILAWLGGERLVDIFASPDRTHSRPVRADEPVALIGTHMLHPHIVLIDFAAATVEIEAQS